MVTGRKAPLIACFPPVSDEFRGGVRSTARPVFGMCGDPSTSNDDNREVGKRVALATWTVMSAAAREPSDTAFPLDRSRCCSDRIVAGNTRIGHYEQK